MRITRADISSFVDGHASLEDGIAGGLVPHRVPAWARMQMRDALFSWAESCATGVVVRFDTVAERVRLTIATTTVTAPGLDVAQPVLVVTRGAVERVVPCPSPTVVLVGEGREILGIDRQPPQQLDIPLEGEGTVEIRLPHNAKIELVELTADRPVTPAAASGLRWTHYGSSISHGMNAISSARTWPAVAARRLGWHLRDLSFSGNAQLDGFVARMIRDAPADVISLKVGINFLNADSMRERAFRPAAHAFLDTIREGRPDTPIALVSAVACPLHEESPGPVVSDPDGTTRVSRRDVEADAGALTLRRTREILAEVVADRADPALTYVDGRELFGDADVAHLYDGLHPDQAGLDLIAERAVPLLRRVLGTA